MKKVLALVTALMLLVMPVLALCEAALLPYEDINGFYSFLYPDAWVVLDKENVASIIAETGTTDNAVLAAAAQAAQAAIESTDIVVLISGDGLASANIIRSDVGVEYTDDMILETAEGLKQTQLTDAPDSVFTLDPQIVELGKHHTMTMAYDFVDEAGTTVSCAQFHIASGTAIYVLTLIASQGSLDAYTADIGIMIGSAELK